MLVLVWESDIKCTYAAQIQIQLAQSQSRAQLAELQAAVGGAYLTAATLFFTMVSNESSFIIFITIITLCTNLTTDT